jgi:hypothetical protein
MMRLKIVSPWRDRTLRNHDLVAFAPQPHHFPDELRRILQVAVDHNHGLPAGIRQAAQGSRGLAKTAREQQ